MDKNKIVVGHVAYDVERVYDGSVSVGELLCDRLANLLETGKNIDEPTASYYNRDDMGRFVEGGGNENR